MEAAGSDVDMLDSTVEGPIVPDEWQDAFDDLGSPAPSHRDDADSWQECLAELHGVSDEGTDADHDHELGLAHDGGDALVPRDNDGDDFLAPAHVLVRRHAARRRLEIRAAGGQSLAASIGEVLRHARTLHDDQLHGETLQASSHLLLGDSGVGSLTAMARRLGIDRKDLRATRTQTAAACLQLERQTWARLEQGFAAASDASPDFQLQSYVEVASYDGVDFRLANKTRTPCDLPGLDIQPSGDGAQPNAAHDDVPNIM